MRRRSFLATSAVVGLGLHAPDISIGRQPEEHKSATGGAGPLAPPASGTIPVAIAISKGTTNIDWVGPEAVFQTWHLDPVSKKHMPRFKIFLVGETTDPVDNLVPDYTFQTAPASKIIVIPAQQGSPALHEWLRSAHESTDVTMSVCTGARQLALAGLLRGHQATTHHDSIDKFAKDFPDVNWVRGVRFVEGPTICTSGGLTAGIDLALRVVERYFGREQALAVAGHLEYEGAGWKVG